jgi:hypothetical protein
MLIRLLVVLGGALVAMPTLVQAEDEYHVESVEEAPPGDVLSKEVLAALQPQGLKIVKGTNRTVCTIWLCKQWNVQGDFEPTASVTYPFATGELIGVVSFNRRGSDFRGQTVPKGVYTLRYARQPVDGNHVGTAPSSDFLVMLSPESDKSPKPVADEMKLFESSGESIETSHPAMLYLTRKPKTPEKPSVHFDEDRELVTLRCKSKAVHGEKSEPLGIEIVVVGLSEEA